MPYFSALIATCLCLWGVVATAQRRDVGIFSTGDVENWENAGFRGVPKSQYKIVDLDGRRVLRARCNASASLYGVHKKIDLNATPVMHWSWRVDKIYSNINEKTKAGDDYVARIYAVIYGGIFKWRTRAINYVWASVVPQGAAFPNPFRDEAMMVVVESGAGKAGQWQQESRNVQADFKRYYDKNAGYIDGVAVMTDCDNQSRTAQAYFGDIYFTAQ